MGFLGTLYVQPVTRQIILHIVGLRLHQWLKPCHRKEFTWCWEQISLFENYHCSAKIKALFIHLIESVIEPINQSFLVQRIRLELQACFVLIDVSEPNLPMHVLKTEFVFFRELLSLRCCGGQKLLGSLHQLLLVESKEMKEASGDELSINTFIWVIQLIFLVRLLPQRLDFVKIASASESESNKHKTSFGSYFV